MATQNHIKSEAFCHHAASDGVNRKKPETIESVDDRTRALEFLAGCEDAFRFIDSHGKIDLTAILTEMEAMKKQEILKMHKYAITQLADGRWQTFLPDERGYNRRKLVRRAKREDLEAVVIKFYKEKVEIIKLEDIAYAWLERKRQEPGFKASSYDRYENHYKRILSELDEKEIRKISPVFLEDYLIGKISADRISLRVWQDLKTVIRGIFKYARRHGYSDISIEQVLENIDEEKKLFTKPEKVHDSREVFTDAEVKLIEKYIDGRENISLVDLGIKLAFRTGLRAGELAAIKYSDYDKDRKRLRVMRTEQHSKNSEGHIEYYFSDEGYLKGDHQAEYLYLTLAAMKIIEQIHEKNPDNDFLFRTDHYIRSQAFTKRLNSICKIIGIQPRPLHKARKTYATRLINAKVEDSLVQTQLRHSDISTTRRYYYFDNRTGEEKSEAIERAIGQY